MSVEGSEFSGSLGDMVPEDEFDQENNISSIN